MAVKTAEDGIKTCCKCGKEFQKSNVRIPTPIRNGEPNTFWFLCLGCFDEEGGVWWVKNIVKGRE